MRSLTSLGVLSFFVGLSACAELETPPVAEQVGSTEQAAVSATGTFFVDGTTLKDYNGYPFQMRGINMPFAWWESQVPGEMATAAARGANMVRITLDKDTTTAADLQTVLDAAKNAKLAAMLYLTDFTGSDNDSDLNGTSGAVAWWTSTGSYSTNGIKAVLTSATYKKFVMINIANEWKGSWGQGSAWKTSYKTAVDTMRANGLDHTLIIDAAGYGQEKDSIKYYGAQLRNELGVTGNGKNIMFSMHMYDSFYNAATVRAGMDACLQTGKTVGSDGNGVANVPCLIGEFGDLHHRTYTCPDGQPAGSYCNVDEGTIMAEARARRMGYIGWSWAKNNSPINTGLDMLTDFAANGGTNTTWGSRLFTGTDGFSQSAADASLWGVIQAEHFIAASEPNTTKSTVASDQEACENSANQYVDIGKRTNQGGCVIGWIDANESWDYEVNIAVAGNQTLKVLTSSIYAGKTISVYIVNTAGTEYLKGTITLPNTGSISTYQWTTITVNEPNLGLKKLRLRTTTGGFNLDAIQWN
jgi:mannan endo-1,4-beta-mannosidase